MLSVILPYLPHTRKQRLPTSEIFNNQSLQNRNLEPSTHRHLVQVRTLFLPWRGREGGRKSIAPAPVLPIAPGGQSWSGCDGAAGSKVVRSQISTPKSLAAAKPARGEQQMPPSRVFCFCANNAGFGEMLRGQQVPMLGSTLLVRWPWEEVDCKVGGRDSLELGIPLTEEPHFWRPPEPWVCFTSISGGWWVVSVLLMVSFLHLGCPEFTDQNQRFLILSWSL